MNSSRTGSAVVPELYDTTLRDGSQREGISLTVTEKLAVAGLLDGLGVRVIEGGWPGAIPRDTDFFRRAANELTLHNAVIAAFGATRRPDGGAARDPQVNALLTAEAPVVTLVAKSDSRHVERALRTSRTENLAMIADTVRLLVRKGRRVYLDAEHFFDGFQADPRHALDVVRVAMDSGASAVVLCDTNGGSLPETVKRVVAETAQRTGARLGIHCHDDSGCAVANSLAAVDAGAVQVQATAHGYGERCGNANLFTVAANLALKNDLAVVTREQLGRMSSIASQIAQVTGIPAHTPAPYVGQSAFTHKAGLHASALRVDPRMYQHTEPESVGNTMRTLVSDMAGRASVEMKAAELGYHLPPASPVFTRVIERVKAAERNGLSYESADASFELLLRDELSQTSHRPFQVETWEVTTGARPGGRCRNHAVVDLAVRGVRRTATGTGGDPADALDQALRRCLEPVLRHVLPVLIDREERVLRTNNGTGPTRVVLTYARGTHRTRTVGVDRNPVAAAWAAVLDAFHHALLEPVGKPTEAASIPPELEKTMAASEVQAMVGDAQ